MISNKKSWLLDLVCLSSLITLLFSFFLGNIPLGVPDEGRYAEIPREMLVYHNYITPYLNGVKYFEKPILFYWLQAGAIKLFGFCEWAVRLPNALMALSGCLLVYAACRLLFDRRTGWLASIILATSILYFGMAHIVTIDMTFSVLVSASLLAFLIATQTINSHKRWFYYSGYLFAALATLAKGLVGFIFPGCIIFVWLLLCKQRRLLTKFYLPAGIIIFLIITLPWHILVQLKNPEFFQFYFLDQQFLRYLTPVAGRYKPAWFFIPVLIGGFLPWISFLPQAIYYHIPKKILPAKQQQIYAFLLLWPSFIFIFFSFSHSKLITYLLPILPALAILVGHYLGTQWQATTPPNGIKHGYKILPILISLIGLIAIIGSRKNIFKQDLQHAIPTFAAITALWLSGSLLGLRFCLRQRPLAAFNSIAGSTAVVLIILLSQHKFIDVGSVKPLAQTLKPLLTSNSEVACYQKYYQDLPYYLQRKVIVVDWRGELDFGMRHQDTSAWMLHSAQFWQQWQGNKRVFVLMDLKTYQNLKQINYYSFYLVGQTARDVLLTNQPLQAAYNASVNHARYFNSA